MATGNALISEALAEAVAARIKGATTDKVLMAAALSDMFAQTAEKRIKAIIKLEDLWSKRAEAYKIRKVATTSTEWKDAHARHSRLIANMENFMAKMYEVAIAAADEATD